jgi:hypothetical protein
LTAGDLGEVGARGNFAEFGGFFVWKRFCGVSAVGAVPTTAVGGRLAANYALIAAMSGWTPMMFMTRVRL